MPTLWGARVPPALTDELTGVLSRLPAQKRSRLSRVRHEADLVRSLTAYGLLERVLSREVPDSPALSALDWTPQGRPCFPCRSGFFFSLSHAGNLAVCALDSLPVGVDVESCGQSLPDYPLLAEAMGFSPPSSQEDFVRRWVLWESWLKFSGRECYTPPCKLRASPGTDRVTLRDGGAPLPGLFYLRPALGHYLAALCTSPGSCRSPGALRMEKE